MSLFSFTLLLIDGGVGASFVHSTFSVCSLRRSALGPGVEVVQHKEGEKEVVYDWPPRKTTAGEETIAIPC